MIKGLTLLKKNNKLDLNNITNTTTHNSKETISFEDLLAFVKGLKKATGTVVINTNNKSLQSYLVMWVWLPLKQLIREYSEPEYINISNLFEDGSNL